MPRTSQGKLVTEASKVFQKADDNWRAGQYEDARKNYEKAASLYHEKEDDEGEAFVLARLGELLLSLENYKQAEKTLQAAGALVADKDFAQNTYGEILIKLAKVYTSQNELQKAKETLWNAKKILENVGNPDLLGDVCDQEAYVFLIENNEKEALKAYQKAAEYYKADHVSLKEASVLRAIARIEIKNKNYDYAHDVLERCRDLYRENGDLLGEASALLAIGCLRYVIKDIEKARKALMKSVYLYGKVSHHYAEAEALLYLARVESCNREKGDFERAKAHYKRSVELFDFMGNDMMKTMVLEEYYNFLNRINGAGL